MTLEKPGRPKPWRVHARPEGTWVTTGSGWFLIKAWDADSWRALARAQWEEDSVLALERASAINHVTEWFDHYGNRHIGARDILRNPLEWHQA